MATELNWKQLGDAGDEVRRRFEEHQLSPSPMTHAAVKAAAHRYAESLAPVVGTQLAFEYEAKFAAVMQGGDRIVALTATLSRLPGTDRADQEMSNQLITEQEGAQAEFDEVSSRIDKAIDVAGGRVK